MRKYVIASLIIIAIQRRQDLPYFPYRTFSHVLLAKTLPFTIGGPGLETSGLIYIAEDQHYFDENRLSITE